MKELSGRFSQLRAIPEAEHPFDRPWHAEAFGLVVAAHQADLFAWKEWVQIFSVNSRSAAAGADEQNDVYYEDWLGTLEELLTHQGMIDAPAVQMRIEQWRQAYLNTPHGEPVVLEAGRTTASGCKPPSKTHTHHHHQGTSSRPVPVFTSPATPKQT